MCNPAARLSNVLTFNLCNFPNNGVITIGSDIIITRIDPIITHLFIIGLIIITVLTTITALFIINLDVVTGRVIGTDATKEQFVVGIAGSIILRTIITNMVINMDRNQNKMD